MISIRLLTVVLFLGICNHARAEARDIDTEVDNIASQLATILHTNAIKKVTVLDFTDLNNETSELGKYIAEQLTVSLVILKKDYSVLDRANLNKILAEHNLTARGLIDPENAKKLGQFAGVDAIIVGVLVPKTRTINMTTKIITTDTAVIAGSTKGEFKTDETVQKFLSQLRRSTEGTTASGETKATEPTKTRLSNVTKAIGDLRVELEPLRIVNGNQYLVTLTFTNTNPKKIAYLTLHSQGNNTLKSSLTDPEGFEFIAETDAVSGLPAGYWLSHLGIQGSARGLPSGKILSGTVKFAGQARRGATPGKCRLQLGLVFFICDGYGRPQDAVESSLMADLMAE